MPQQQSLFGNLPQLDNAVKERNKAIVEKANKPATTRTRTTSTRSGSNKLANKIELIRQSATQMLNEDEHRNWYELIRNVTRFRQYMKNVRENGIAGIDTETNSLDPVTGEIVGLCLYTPDERPMYAPMNHTDVYGTKLPNQIPNDVVAEELRLCEEAGVKWVFHNAKFDIRFFRNYLNLRLTPYWDTMIAGNLLNENEPHQLKVMWNKYCNRGKDMSANTFDKLFEGMGFNYVPIEIGYLYAAKDPWITFELYLFQLPFFTPEDPKCKRQRLEETASLYFDIELPLIPVLCDMEDVGVAIDTEYAANLSKKYNDELDVVTSKINEFLMTLDYMSLDSSLREKLSNPINMGSPTQLAIITYDMLGMKSPDRESPRGTGEPILKHYIDSGVGFFFKDVLEYRGISKLLGTYIDKLPAEVKEKTGRLHGWFNQYGAKTGRFSSSDPNLQNIPSKNKEIRKMFKATNGYVMIGADYSQQEPRVLAHLCWMLFGDERMMKAYSEGKDLYAWMASEIYNVDYDFCKEKFPDGSSNPEGKKRRDSVKSIILGLMYGRGAKAIGEQLGWSTEEAQRVVNLFFETFPAIKQVIEYYLNMARELGYIQTVFGRKRRLPDIQLPEYDFERLDGKPVSDDERAYLTQRMKAASFGQKNAYKAEIRKQYGIKVHDNGGKIADAERQTLNSVIQGTSADITKLSMVLLGTNEELKQLGFRLLLTVHDENIGEAPREHARRCAELMSRIMIDACKEKISVPMKVDAEVTERWYGEDVLEQLLA